MKKFAFDKSLIFERLPNRIRTRFISCVAFITSVITFISGFCIFLYMKSPQFEYQLLGQVIKHLRPIIIYEIEKRFEERNQKFNFEY